MKTRDEIDEIAWQTIHAKPQQKIAEAQGKRSLDYRQMEERMQAGVDFEHVWSDFLHACYDYRDASFFQYPSPESKEWQALLAGAAEFLSVLFELPVPSWVNQPRYFLPRPWDPDEDLGLDMSEFYAEKLAKSPEAFRKRNVAFLSRNLITL